MAVASHQGTAQNCVKILSLELREVVLLLLATQSKVGGRRIAANRRGVFKHVHGLRRHKIVPVIVRSLHSSTIESVQLKADDNWYLPVYVHETVVLAPHSLHFRAST